MNRIIRTIIAVILIAIITVAAISITQDIGKKLRLDVTEKKLYTLSQGSKDILAKLNQPIKMKFYYTRTAAMKGPDNIRFFNDYAAFVQSLLQEYVTQSGGMVELEIIDPRPFSPDEAAAMRQGLKRIPMSEDENFIFGLVVQTQFGASKSLEMFQPERQSFVEYDISYLLDTTITRKKKVVGVLSSLLVMGDDVTGYMAQMMAMQGKQPRPAWTIIEQIKQKYEVKAVAADCENISNIDILLVIHPKQLPEKTLYAIDQFVLEGGNTIVCVDPHCLIDKPDRQKLMRGQPQSSSSNLESLFEKWGLRMQEYRFAGDRKLAISAQMNVDQGPENIIGFLGLDKKECFNQENIITAQLNDVRMIFAGTLDVVSEPNGPEVQATALLSTTNRGNNWSVSSPYELMMPNPKAMMDKFFDGIKPVNMGYLITGKFKSAFPDGVTVQDDPNVAPVKLTGIAEATGNCAVVVFSDVDFITDMLAYQKSFFGMAPQRDNATLLINAIDQLGGSSELISIRSKGNFRRGFHVIEEIELKAQQETKQQEDTINAQIAQFQSELQKMINDNQQQGVIGSEIIVRKQQLEEQLYQQQLKLRKVKNEKRKNIESLKDRLRNFNTLPGPILTLVIAVILGIRRSVKKRHYISSTR